MCKFVWFKFYLKNFAHMPAMRFICRAEDEWEQER